MRNDIDLLVDLVILLKDVLLRAVESRLERHQHLNHELRVLGVSPVVGIRFEVRAVAARLVMCLLHPEMDFEQVYEICEQEAAVNVCSDVIRKLRHESLIDLTLDGIVLVVGPVVFKVALESLGHLLG